MLRKLNYIGNNTADVKIIIDYKEYDIQDIEWTGYKDGGKIIIKAVVNENHEKNRFIGQELIDKITKMVDEYPNVEDNVKNNLVIGQVLKRDDWDRQKKIDFIIEYFRSRIYGEKQND